MAEENVYEVEVTNILNDLARNPRDQTARTKAREALLSLVAQAWNGAMDRGSYEGKMEGYQLGVQAGYFEGFKAGLYRSSELEDLSEEEEVPVKRKGGRPKKGD